MAIVSKADARGGGASRVACDLVDRLPDAGIETTHFAAWSSSGFTSERRPAYGPLPFRLATTVAHAVARRSGFGELVPFELPLLLGRILSGGFDIVHFHDTSSAYSPLTLEAVAAVVPTVWTFHDCSPFTGGCLYPQTSGCTRYLTGCGECPQLGEWPLDGSMDTTASASRARRRAHASGRITTAAPSRWMSDLAVSSGILKKPPRIVANMVDTAVFAPASDVDALRTRLGLPIDRPVLAVSSGNVSDPRKGIAKALEAASLMRGSAPLVLLVGVPHASVRERFPDVQILSTGYVSDRSELAEWLGASDAFVFTSSADNQPLSVLEALACGTPVYGWPTGGVSEIVEDGVSGRMIPSGDAAMLALVLERDISDGTTYSMRGAARRSCVARHAPASFVEAHLSMYGEALDRPGRNPE